MWRSVSLATLNSNELRGMNAYWRAANYLSVGQIYLYDNPLLREPLKLAHVKPLVVGHWGTTPGQNFIYVHLNRAIKKYDLNMFYIAGPGHGGPALVGNTYLEGTYSEIYPNITQDEAGMKKLFKQFSFPGGISSHVAPTTPGSIHEGGELGYSLSHAFGAAFDNPDLIVACVVGDGEAETGPLATAWQSNKFLDPDHRRRRSADPPSQRLQDQQPHRPCPDRARGAGAVFQGQRMDAPIRGRRRSGEDASNLWPRHWKTPSTSIKQIQESARKNNDATRPRWPMIVLQLSQGLDGAKSRRWAPDRRNLPRASGAAARGRQASRTCGAARKLDEKLQGRKSCSTTTGGLLPELAELAPTGERRMGANPHANGGILLRDLRMPDFRDHAVERAVARRGRGSGYDRSRRVLARRGKARIVDQRNFRIFGPDETVSNLLGAVFEVTSRQWEARTQENDEFLAPEGRVLDSMLSEHQCEGWLEGYLLTGTTRAVQQLRGVHSHRGLDVQPARQMA